MSDAGRLRTRMRDDGYLFLPGIAPREKLIELRREMLGILESAGWIKSAHGSLDAIWSGAGPFTEGEPQYMAVYQQIINAPRFRAWADESVFTDIVSKIVAGPVLAHRLRIGRVTFPSNVAQTTAAHQDFEYIRGTAETYTIWTPVGDCPIALGGLAVLRGSHRGGYIEHGIFAEKKYANRGLHDEQLPQSDDIAWHSGDFAAGDVLVFHSHTIHKALPNLTSDQLRLSTDNRYTRVGAELAELSTKSHYGL
jgi:ectoine hydroxylase-related dioxygenase (phytanoyl-CoA dioxygenase family)